MTGRRLTVAVAVGLVGLSSPAAAAGASNTGVWRYVVTSVSGSATWRYSAANGSGVNTVTFQGRPRLGRPLARTSSVLHGTTRYKDQNSNGCGPITRTTSQNYRGPSFSVQQPLVVVSWNFPLPDQTCSDPAAKGVAQQLQAMMAQKIPLAHFTCERMVLQLRGAAQLAQGGIAGKLTYHASVIIKRV